MARLSTCPPLTRDSVIEAYQLVAPHVHRTPVVTCDTLDEQVSIPRSVAERACTRRTPRIRLYFKLENAQRTGSFKVRGAFHAVKRLMLEDRDLIGVLTHSSGNHAQALALVARDFGLDAHIVMPANSLPRKIAATRSYGADVVFSGSTSDERQAVAARVEAETGARLVPPYDHPDIILGQGTMGLEFQDQVAELMEGTGDGLDDGLDAIMTPCGGGGMLSGVALSCQDTGILVFGAEPSFQGADDARRGYYSGSRVTAVSSLTVADGLRTPLGEHPWAIIHDRRLVSGMYSVSEADILAAMRLLFEHTKLVVEPSACVGLAVALFNEDFRDMVARTAGNREWHLGLVLSGGNVGLDSLGAMFAQS